MSEWHLARGFRFAGLHCGVRPDANRRDLALIVTDVPAAAAGVFTQNCVRAAPVRVCQERLPRADARGIVVCSGNANACTGKRGLDDARRMTTIAAEELACRPEQVLVCSTGVIGRHLPMVPLENGIRASLPQLAASPAALEAAAQAITTTDTRIKICTCVAVIDGVEVRFTGLAKGAAMIGPNMATMLAFVLTDAAVDPNDLQAIARRAAACTFNCISVEGHTSTNDSLVFLANGLAGGPALTGSAGLNRFEEEATKVCGALAHAIAADAEGASHLITIHVEGLRSEEEARCIAKTVAESALVKTAIFGADPNWGRIVSAAGYAGVDFEEEQLSCWLGEILLYEAGVPRPFDAAAASAYLKNQRDVAIRLRFTLGSACCTFFTCDLGYEYVRLNAEYTT